MTSTQTQLPSHTDDSLTHPNNIYGHDDVIKWKHFLRYWPFVRGIHRSPVNSPHKGQWRGSLIFYLICVWINGWLNNREAGDLRRHRAHYDATVMHGNISLITAHFVGRIYQSSVDISHKGSVCGALGNSLLSGSASTWTNSRIAVDFRSDAALVRHCNEIGILLLSHQDGCGYNVTEQYGCFSVVTPRCLHCCHPILMTC